MTLMFQRAFELIVDKILITDLDCSFSVTKTAKKKPNACNIKIMNLSDQNRGALALLKEPVVRLKAGYVPQHELTVPRRELSLGSEGEFELEPSIFVPSTESGIPWERPDLGTLFIGEMDFVFSNYNNVDWVTTMQAGDGLRGSLFKRTERSFAKGTQMQDVLRRLVNDSDIDEGNLSKALLEGEFSDVLNGYVASGPTMKELERATRSSGLEFSIQNRKFQFTKIGESVGNKDWNKAIVVSPETGMIGSPTFSNETMGTKKKKKTKSGKNKITCTSLLNPNIAPRKQVVIKSTIFPQDKRIIVQAVTHSGNTAGGEWYTKFVGTAI